MKFEKTNENGNDTHVTVAVRYHTALTALKQQVEG
jgi:polysaccharide pyruvyl transferase WcaK-like protein